MPAARVGDPIAHSNAGLGMALGVLAGVAAGALLVGATIATGGAALAVVAAVGGAAALTSFGGLKGMHIGAASMGPPTGMLVLGAPTVLINSKQATMTAIAMATCAKDPGPIPLATGSSTVIIFGGMAGREGETMGCSAKVVAPCSLNVVIGGASAQDPRVAIQPEVPEWAVTGLQMLGVAGAILALPYSVVALGVGGTVAAGVLGAAGGFVGGKAMRALGESMGLSEGWVRAMEASGELGGGMLGGAAGARRFGTPRPPTPSQMARGWQGKGDYPGVDRYRDITLKKGTVIYAGHPGQGNYYTTPSAINRAGGSQQQLFNGLQVKPHDVYGHRPNIQAYEVTADTPAAFGITSANPQHGSGGLPQIFVPDFGNLKPIGNPVPLKVP
jgi:uncharacterized Zn-binding protein involved in type VI secretion